METAWLIIVAVMIAAYVVLDGFDLGAGIIYLIVGKSGDERRKVLRSIGPVWDGNEVWLLAAGGTLFFAYPQLYASAFSGFYLPLMMVLWLLMLRGIGIELRAHMNNPVWRGFFDVVFCGSSALLAFFFGAALGNVIRGVPLGADGYFFEPLWTNFQLGPHPGILDWYTVMAGGVALVTLTAHGALYVTLKTDGELGQRARRVATALASAACPDVGQPGGDVVRAPIDHGELFGRPDRISDPHPRFRQPGPDACVDAKRERVAGLSGFVCLPRRDAWGRGFRALPGRAPGQYRSGVQPDHLQRRSGSSRPERGPGVVDARHDSRPGLLRLHLPDVPRQGTARGRGILSLERAGPDFSGRR